RDILLKVIDDKWIDHLHCIDALRAGIGLRAYGQKDPLIEYKNEAFGLFNKMMHEIQSETVIFIFRTKFELQVNNLIENGEVETPLSQSSKDFSQTEETKNVDFSKVGRNDPCPCGSGLKYKKCCGAKK
ncbi:MAG: SEC-C domain-containing protein, partial [Endomicrobiaceae bacterium]|nr:SEC-C domain-containing protein [Endomicrobiaceae bacterium]